MKREALIRELRRLAREKGVTFTVHADRGKGAHYLIEFGDRKTTLQSGELKPLTVKRIKGQLGII